MKCMVTRYIIIGNFIYKRLFDGTFIRFINKTKENKSIKQVHDSINGCHFNGKVIYHKLLRLGYYWSSM